MLKKSVLFRWDDEKEEAFIKLKETLCKAPVLAYPNPDVPYIVDTDASNLAIGTVPSQVHDSEENVIIYGSKPYSRVTMTMVYDKKRTFCYNSFCNGEVLLLLVKPGVDTPYRPFNIKVAKLVPR